MTNQTITNVREGRHLAKIALAKAYNALEGREGLTKDEQITRLFEAQSAVQEAAAALDGTAHIAKTRDFEAHQQEKDGPPPVEHLYITEGVPEFEA